MAREAYRSLYGDLTKLNDDSLLDGTVGTDDDELLQLLLAASEWVEGYCNRFFYSLTRTLEFDGDGTNLLAVPDLIAITTLKTDDNADNTHETAWTAQTDFYPEPHNASPTSFYGHPYSHIRARAKGTYPTFPAGENNIEIAGKWGYREVKEDSGSNPTAQQSAAATTLAVTSGTHFAIGQTVIVDSEQQLITAISANTLTVTRALNGATAAVHETTADVFILRWPAAIERACLITAARMFKRAPNFEPFYVDADVDTDVRLLLEAYRKVAA